MRTKRRVITGIFFIMPFLAWIGSDEYNIRASQKNYEIRYEGSAAPGRWLRNIKLEYTLDGAKSVVLMQIFFPKNYKKGNEHRTIIALHGYSDSYRDWANETYIDGYANNFNFVIVCPDMRKTTYETRYYPETKYKWGPVPGGKFVGEILISAIRDEFGLAAVRGKTGIIGTSSGARGAMIVASVYKDYFSVAAGLSGYYDHLSMTKERELISVYGEYSEFRERWENDDNLMKLADNLANTNIFLFHGYNDSFIPKDQSLVYAIKLGQVRKRANGSMKITHRERRYVFHNWKGWNAAIQEAMEFFDKYLAK